MGQKNMDSELTVACCLWGYWPARGWGVEYVERLSRGVKRNLSRPYRFVCFSDTWFHAPGVEVRPLNSPTWAGCLPKLYVYSPQAHLRGRVLLFDLDNVITGSLDAMAAYDGEYAVRAWFAGYDKGDRVPDGDMISFMAGSPVARDLWASLTADVSGAEERTGGRERYFIRDHVAPDLWQDVLGHKAILSYKRHLRDAPLTADTSIVSFHDGGKPGGTCRPHQLTTTVPWLREHWI